MLKRLDHIQLAMPPGEEEKARAFFVGILDLTEIEKPEPLASRGGCWFENEGVIVHCGVEEGFSAAKKAHPAFVAVNLDELAEVLSENGKVIVIGCFGAESDYICEYYFKIFSVIGPQ